MNTCSTCIYRAAISLRQISGCSSLVNWFLSSTSAIRHEGKYGRISFPILVSHAAASDQWSLDMESMLQKGVDVNASDRDERTALHIAASRGAE